MEDLLPYVRFKKVQAKAFLQAADILSARSTKELTNRDLLKLIALMLVIQQENYATKSKKTREELQKILGLTP